MIHSPDVALAISAADRLHSTELLGVDDLIFLPYDSPIDRLASYTQDVEPNSFVVDPPSANYAHFPHLMALRADYLRHVSDDGREPEYMKRLHRDLVAHLRRLRVLSGDPHPVYHACDRLPNTGAEYAVVKGGLVEQCVDTFGLRRLEGISQMGFLHDQVVGDQIHMLHHRGRFAHTRFDHVMNVMALATLIGHRCGLSRRELTHLRVAALTHDAMMPAGGDTTKEMDPEALCEDAHYTRLFERHACADFIAKHKLDTTLLTDIVQGKGILGQMLNVADKCGYTARDVDVYLHRCMTHMNPKSASLIRDAADAHEAVCGIWDAFDVVTDHQGETRFACRDPERLYHFLHLRALMFRHVYYDTDARSGEFVLSRVLLSYLYHKGVLTYDHLLRMTDAELLEEIERHFGSLRFTQPAVRMMCAFSTREEAETYRADLSANAHMLTFIYTVPPLSSGVGFDIVHHGRVTVFANYSLEHAMHLESITHHTQPYRVYGISISC